MAESGADKNRWFQRFVASGIRGEVSDATIRGYLRSASQLEDVWQQIDDGVDALITQGIAPWDAYAKLGYALALVRACRTNVVFVQQLLQADAAADPASAGYLPKVTYDQALALSEHIEPFIEEAIKASTNPHYVPMAYSLPLALGPRIRYADQRLPLPHLQGIIGAAQEMREWTAGMLAKYELALEAAKIPVPQPVSTHLQEMKSEMSLGDFHLRSGVDMVGQISQGEATNELAAKAEDFLWEAMEGFFKVSQLVAFPTLPVRQPASQPRIGVRKQQDVQRIPPRPEPVVPTQPSPDVSKMLDQVTSVPEVTRELSTQPSPDVSKMLNQVTAAPQTHQEIPAQSSPDVSDLLDQVIANPETPRAISKQASPDVSALLDQVIASPDAAQNKSVLPQGTDTEHRGPRPSQAASEDTLLDMLSDICGEPKQQD